MGHATSCCQAGPHCCKLGPHVATEHGLSDAWEDVWDDAIPIIGEHMSVGSRSAKSTNHFRARLAKAEHNGKLGIDVDYCEDMTVMPIVAITGGAAASWNKARPAQALRPGDVILEVNGRRGNLQEMLEACQHDDMLHLIVARDVKPSMFQPGGPFFAQKRCAVDPCACIADDERHAPCMCVVW